MLYNMNLFLFDLIFSIHSSSKSTSKIIRNNPKLQRNTIVRSETIRSQTYEYSSEKR